MADYSALYRLAPFDVSAPKMDLYTPLAGIANQITENQNLALRQKQLQDAAAQREIQNRISMGQLGVHQGTLSLAQQKFKEEQDQRTRELDALKALGGIPSSSSVPGSSSDVTAPIAPVSIAPQVSPFSPQPIANQGAPGVQVAGPAQTVSTPNVQAEIDRLQRGLLNPDLPSSAKAYIQERLKTLNPDFNKTPVGAGMIEQAKEEAKVSVKAEQAAREDEQKAYQSINRYSTLKPLADSLKTGQTLPTRITVGAFAKSVLGDNSGPVLSVLGLNPDDIGNAQAFNAIANQSIAGLIGTGPNALLPANNFTEKDRELILSVVPQLGDDPRAVAIKMELANKANQLVVQRGVEWRQYKKANPGARYTDFLDDWNTRLSAKDRFGDISREAIDLLKNTQPGGVNAPPSRKTKSGVQWSIE